MAYRFACERADLVAAIAPVAGSVGIDSCRPARPVSVSIIHGRADEYVPYGGGEGRKSLAPRTDRSVAENRGIWLKADGCDENGKSCREGTEVRLIVHDGGHVWPGGRPGPRYGNVDPVVPEPKATETIWDFFKAHARPGPR